MNSELESCPEIKDFLDKGIEFENIFDLPQFYPKKGELDEFQYGYRYNPIEKESLIGDKEGDWKGNWFVICTNDCDDPFVIDISEKAIHYPVYFARHGEGSWSLEKISNSLHEFKTTLMAIKEIENDYSLVIKYIEKNQKGNFWLEIIAELQAEQEDE